MYKFLVGLTTPFTNFPAYKLGVINEHGEQIVPNRKLSPEQNNAFNDFDRLVVSLKRIISLVPDPSIRSYMKSPVLAAKLMSEQCQKMGGDPDYFMELMARELLACRFIDEETAMAPANSISNGGIQGMKPDDIGIPKEAAARHKKRGRRRFFTRAPMNEETVVQKQQREYPMYDSRERAQWYGARMPSSAKAIPGFIGKSMGRSIIHYITRPGAAFGSAKPDPIKPKPTPPVETGKTDDIKFTYGRGKNPPTDYSVGSKTKIPDQFKLKRNKKHTYKVNIPPVEETPEPTKVKIREPVALLPHLPQPEKKPIALLPHLPQSLPAVTYGGGKKEKVDPLKQKTKLSKQFKLDRRRRKIKLDLSSIPNLFGAKQVDATTVKAEMANTRTERRRRTAEKRKRDQELRDRNIDPKSGQASFGW
jgi:hypothetical protein